MSHVSHKHVRPKIGLYPYSTWFPDCQDESSFPNTITRLFRFIHKDRDGMAKRPIWQPSTLSSAPVTEGGPQITLDSHTWLVSIVQWGDQPPGGEKFQETNDTQEMRRKVERRTHLVCPFRCHITLYSNHNNHQIEVQIRDTITSTTDTTSLQHQVAH